MSDQLKPYGAFRVLCFLMMQVAPLYPETLVLESARNLTGFLEVGGGESFHALQPIKCRLRSQPLTTAGPGMTSFRSTSSCFNIGEMLQDLNSYLYHLAFGKISSVICSSLTVPRTYR